MSEISNEIDNTESDDKSARTRLELLDWIQCAIAAVILGVLIFVFIGRTIGVDGPSMQITLLQSDRVVISNLFYTPSGGDIIVFKAPADQFEHPLVKRVIATAGQTIDIDSENGNVFIDGVLLSEPYIRSMKTSSRGFQGPLLIPEGYVFVMGDNRDRSTDSREDVIGLVDTRYILGKVIFVLLPGADENGIRDWSRIGTAS